LLDMGVEDYLLTSTVNAVLAQRLVRRLCRHCREPYIPTEEMISRYDLLRFAGDGSITLYRPVGCEHCGHTGYRGRSAILELLLMTDPVRQLVLKHSDASEIARTAAAGGMRSMLDDGLRKVVSGETSLEEICRVTQEQSCLNQLPEEPVTRTATNTSQCRMGTSSRRQIRLGAMLRWFKQRQSAVSGFVWRK